MPDNDPVVGALQALTRQIELSATATQAQLGQVLAEVRTVKDKVGDQAVVVGQLREVATGQAQSLERNWKATESLEARLRALETRPAFPEAAENRLRAVETSASVSAAKLALLGALCAILGGGIGSAVSRMLTNPPAAAAHP